MDLSKFEIQYFLDHYFCIPNTALMTLNQLLYLMMRPERHTQEMEVKYNSSVREMMKKRNINITDRYITNWFNSDVENEIFSSVLLKPSKRPIEFYFTRDENNEKIVFSMINGMIVKINERFSTLGEPDYNHLIIDTFENKVFKNHDMNRLVIVVARFLATQVEDVFMVDGYETDLKKYPFFYNSLPDLKRKILSPNTTNIIADVLVPFCLKYREEIVDMYTDYFSDQADMAEEEEDASLENCILCCYGIKEGDGLRVRPCGHQFHKTCLAHMIYINCPLCRSTLDT